MSLPSCACVCQRRSFHTWPRATLTSFPMPSTLLCRTCVDAGHCCIRCTCTSFHSRTLSEHSSHHPVKSQKQIVVSPFPLPLKRIRRNTLYTLRFLLPGARPFPSETRTRDQMLATVFFCDSVHIPLDAGVSLRAAIRFLRLRSEGGKPPTGQKQRVVDRSRTPSADLCLRQLCKEDEPLQHGPWKKRRTVASGPVTPLDFCSRQRRRGSAPL